MRVPLFCAPPMDGWTLRIAVRGLEPVARKVDRALLSIGSDPGADVVLASVPAQWAMVRARSDGLEVRRIGVAGARLLRPGESLTVDEVVLTLDVEEASRDHFVVRYVTAVLNRHDGNREAGTVALGISVRSLYRYLS